MKDKPRLGIVKLLNDYTIRIMKLKQTNHRLPEPLIERLKDHSELVGYPQTMIVRWAIEDYLARFEAERKRNKAILDRLDYLRELWGDEGISRGLCDDVRAAIAEAEGGAP